MSWTELSRREKLEAWDVIAAHVRDLGEVFEKEFNASLKADGVPIQVRFNAYLIPCPPHEDPRLSE